MEIQDIPVLVIGFNRPNHLIKVIDELRLVKPKKIYFSVDGPRAGNLTDVEKTKQVKNLISQFDWDCELLTKFSDENLGCKYGPVEAINWIFANEEIAIILEDDIKPNLSFFNFCHDMLEKYRTDNRVFLISGSNSLGTDKGIHSDFAYRFSALPYIWGWATWKRAWTEYSVNMENWRKDFGLSGIRKFFGCSYLEAFILGKFLFDRVASGKLDAWDYQWVYFAMKTGKVAIISNTNLTENIGFGKESTHTLIRPNFLIPRSEQAEILLHPPLQRDIEGDLWILRNAYGLVSYKKYLKNLSNILVAKIVRRRLI